MDAGRGVGGVKVTTPSGVQIAFDDEKHRYMVNGARFANVTTILGCVDKSPGLMAWAVRETKEGRDYRETRDTAATRGTSVHDALEILARDNTPPVLDQFPEEDRGYVQGLAKWWIDHRPSAIHVEQLVASLKHRYAGKLDLVCEIQGVPHLVDLKTSKRVYETHHLQLAGYALAYAECGFAPLPRICAVLRVGEEGEYEFVHSRADAKDWLAVCGLYEALKKVRRKPKVAA